MKKTAKHILKGGAAAAVLAAGAYYANDMAQSLKIKALPDTPYPKETHQLLNDLLYYLEYPHRQETDGVTVDEAYVQLALHQAKVYIDARYDCMDFRMQPLLRIQYTHLYTIRALCPAGPKMIEDMFLNAKYWMTEPGEDSLCYWSENHQILFAVGEYLAGQMWPERIFTNDGATGLEHMQRGRKRIAYWLEHRAKYGFSEFNSSNYYKYNIGPAANFIQFAAPEDADLVQRMKMLLDLLFFDLASNMFRWIFCAPTSRAYIDNMAGNPKKDGLHPVTNILWNGSLPEDQNPTDEMLLSFYAMLRARDTQGKPLYEFPPVLLEIGRDCSKNVRKFSYGLNTAELAEKGYVGHGDNQIMMQMGMEAFTNPEVIYNTITYLDKNQMFSNKAVNPFKIINNKLAKTPERLEAISRKGNPMPNGIASQRANLYVYRTPHYQLANAQRYHPGCYGAQQMLGNVIFGAKSVVFTAHPARHETAGSVSATPGYWAGFGRAPHGVQHENVLLLLYQIPKLPGFLELYQVPQFTHTYLPEAYMDEVRLADNYVFARTGKAYLALIGAGNLAYKPHSNCSAKAFGNDMDAFPHKRFDLIQQGNRQFWIYELSDQDTETFNMFCVRVMNNKVEYNGEDRLLYRSRDKTYETRFNGGFFLNGQKQELEHKRFDSAYCQAEREQTEFRFACNGHSLHVDFENLIREFD